jgi:hypothetical protein
MPGGSSVSRSWRRPYMEALCQDLEKSLPTGIRSLPVAVLFVRYEKRSWGYPERRRRTPPSASMGMLHSAIAAAR